MRVGQIRRRDASEKEIVEALRKVGCFVTPISGEGAPDLLVEFQRRLFVMEVKSKRGKRTPAQERSHWPIIRSVDEALWVIHHGVSSCEP